MTQKILHVAAVDFTTSKLLAPQLRDLLKRGYDVRVVAGRTDERIWDDLADLQPIDIQFPRTMSPIRMCRATFQLAKLIREWQPDVVHLHTPAASLPVRLAPRRSWPNETRLFYTVHGYIHMWPPSGLIERAAQLVEKALARRTDVSLFQSREDYVQAKRKNYASELVFLGNGVEDDWFNISPPQAKGVGEVTLIFVGRLVREKGILDLLDALEMVKGARLHVVGDALPSDRDGVAEEVRSRLQLSSTLRSRVAMHGMLARADVMKVYQSAHAVVLPSYREGVPRSLIEGMAASRPAIATRIRGCTELVTHNQNGILVPPGDVSSLADAIRTLTHMSAGEFASYSFKARQSADPLLRETAVFERLAHAYEL